MRRMMITGRLTRDPELKEVDSKLNPGTKDKLLRFGIANNDNGKDKDPDYFDAACWDTLATWGQQYLKKGTKVLLSGTPRNTLYADKEGNKHSHFKLVVDRIELIG